MLVLNHLLVSNHLCWLNYLLHYRLLSIRVSVGSNLLHNWLLLDGKLAWEHSCIAQTLLDRSTRDFSCFHHNLLIAIYLSILLLNHMICLTLVWYEFALLFVKWVQVCILDQSLNLTFFIFLLFFSAYRLFGLLVRFFYFNLLRPFFDWARLKFFVWFKIRLLRYVFTLLRLYKNVFTLRAGNISFRRRWVGFDFRNKLNTNFMFDNIEILISKILLGIVSLLVFWRLLFLLYIWIYFTAFNRIASLTKIRGILKLSKVFLMLLINGIPLAFIHLIPFLIQFILKFDKFSINELNKWWDISEASYIFSSKLLEFINLLLKFNVKVLWTAFGVLSAFALDDLLHLQDFFSLFDDLNYVFIYKSFRLMGVFLPGCIVLQDSINLGLFYWQS